MFGMIFFSSGFLFVQGLNAILKKNTEHLFKSAWSVRLLYLSIEQSKLNQAQIKYLKLAQKVFDPRSGEECRFGPIEGSRGVGGT